MKSVFPSVFELLCLKLCVTLAILPAPHIWHIRTYNSGIELEWHPLVSPNPNDPILGYKIMVWEPEYKTVFVFKDINGTSEAVATKEPVESTRMEPTRTPAFVVVTNSINDTNAFIYPTKKGIMYDIRGQAFTDTEIGPMSSPLGVGIGVG